MRVIHLGTGDLYGGAAIAAGRRHVALAATGGDSRILVRRHRSPRHELAQPGGWMMRAWYRLRRRCDRLAKSDAVERKIMVLGSSWISTYGAGLAGGTISKPSTLFGEARP